MKLAELLKTFLQVPELSTVGNPQERAAFIALHIDGRTVREAGEAIGVSKSHVRNLADLFQAKLTKKIMEIGKKRDTPWSPEYRRLYEELSELLPYDYGGDHKIGNFDPQAVTREDWAEARGGVILRFDDE